MFGIRRIVNSNDFVSIIGGPTLPGWKITTIDESGIPNIKPIVLGFLSNNQFSFNPNNDSTLQIHVVVVAAHPTIIDMDKNIIPFTITTELGELASDFSPYDHTIAYYVNSSDSMDVTWLDDDFKNYTITNTGTMTVSGSKFNLASDVGIYYVDNKGTMTDSSALPATAANTRFSIPKR